MDEAVIYAQRPRTFVSLVAPSAASFRKMGSSPIREALCDLPHRKPSMCAAAQFREMSVVQIADRHAGCHRFGLDPPDPEPAAFDLCQAGESPGRFGKIDTGDKPGKDATSCRDEHCGETEMKSLQVWSPVDRGYDCAGHENEGCDPLIKTKSQHGPGLGFAAVGFLNKSAGA